MDRDAPDLHGIRLLQPAERFVWGILPHAARSFAPCIVALPSRLALPAALAYLYCRVLDTYEDLGEDRIKSAEALALFPRRLDALRTGSAPPELPALSFRCRDQRDEAHALLAEEVPRLDQLYVEFDEAIQEIIFDLVSDMAEGMRGADWAIGEEGGAVRDGAQLRSYCEAVLGNPIRFAARLFSFESGGGISLEDTVELAAMDVGEFLQLANVTRDVEKDLARGVCYHPHLAEDLRGLGEVGDAGRILAARCALMDRALSLAPSYLRLIDGLQLRAGQMSASALLMLWFTEDYYFNCAARVGVGAPKKTSSWGLVMRAWPSIFSGRWARNRMGEAAERLSRLRDDLPLQASSMYLS